MHRQAQILALINWKFNNTIIQNTYSSHITNKYFFVIRNNFQTFWCPKIWYLNWAKATANWEYQFETDILCAVLHRILIAPEFGMVRRAAESGGLNKRQQNKPFYMAIMQKQGPNPDPATTIGCKFGYRVELDPFQQSIQGWSFRPAGATCVHASLLIRNSIFNKCTQIDFQLRGLQARVVCNSAHPASNEHTNSHLH